MYSKYGADEGMYVSGTRMIYSKQD